MSYLLVRKYKDGSVWTTLGSEKRINKLHSYCSGSSYVDEIYLVTGSGIYQRVI